MYFIEGQYKKAAVISLGGVKHINENVDSLVKNRRIEREERKLLREKCAACIIIQAYFRSHLSRKQLSQRLREEFDDNIEGSDSSNLYHMMTLVTHFYQKDDKERLRILCQKSLKFENILKTGMTTNKAKMKIMCKIISLCIRDLRTNTTYAINLRFLEVFGRCTDDRMHAHILNVTINKEYYLNCYELLKRSLGVNLSESILSLMMQPLITNNVHILPKIRSYAVEFVFNKLLDVDRDDNIEQWFNKYHKEHRFSFSLLDPAIMDGVNKSPIFLLSLLSIYEPYLGVMPKDILQYYFRLISSLLITTVSVAEPPRPQAAAADDADDEELTDEETLVDTRMVKIRDKCMKLLTSGLMTDMIIGAMRMTKREADMQAVADILNILIQHKRITVPNCKIIYSAIYDTKFMRDLWTKCISCKRNSGDRKGKLMMMSMVFKDLTISERNRLLSPLALFIQMLHHLLFTLHDKDFFLEDTAEQLPFTLKELRKITSTLCDFTLKFIYHYERKPVPGLTVSYTFMLEKLCALLKHLHTHDMRRHFLGEDFWIRDEYDFSRFCHLDYETFRRVDIDINGYLFMNMKVLTELPFVIPFHDRVKLFRYIIMCHRHELQSSNFFQRIQIMIRRNYIYEDSFDKLSYQNVPDMNLQLQVSLKNFADMDEAGIDGGGLFRELMSELIKSGFHLDRGLFKYTHDKHLYPNPDAKLLYKDYEQHYFFLGRVVGKLLYENVLNDLPLADFFVSKLLIQDQNLDLDHLASLDPELYKNLMIVKEYRGDFEDLNLDFTVVNSSFGVNNVHELKQNGKNISVTRDNVISYVHLVADYHLNVKLGRHCNAFKMGISNVIPIRLLEMFDSNELLIVLGGDGSNVNVQDLIKNTYYSGGYYENHPVIILFWKVIDTFDDVMIRKLLKFVTSCSRSPLQGFGELNPKFCIHSAGDDPSRLPTSSTCMNLLKLPCFDDFETLKTKLIYAIESESGFELS